MYNFNNFDKNISILNVPNSYFNSFDFSYIGNFAEWIEKEDKLFLMQFNNICDISKIYNFLTTGYVYYGDSYYEMYNSIKLNIKEMDTTLKNYVCEENLEGVKREIIYKIKEILGYDIYPSDMEYCEISDILEIEGKKIKFSIDISYREDKKEIVKEDVKYFCQGAFDNLGKLVKKGQEKGYFDSYPYYVENEGGYPYAQKTNAIIYWEVV